MAITATTLASAVSISDTSIVVAAATGATANGLIRVDQEIMQVVQIYTTGLTIPVLRGRDGTAGLPHKSGANVVFETVSDYTGMAPSTAVQFPAVRAHTMTSISVSGAIPLNAPGSDATVFLNGTTIIAATLANPTKDMDGDELTIMGNGKAAHTVTYAAGIGALGGTADVLTFSATQAGGFKLVAANGFWNSTGTVAGAATLAGVGIA